MSLATKYRYYIDLICEVCNKKNYVTTLHKNKDVIKEFKRKKYCNKCRKHTIHKAKELKKAVKK